MIPDWKLERFLTGDLPEEEMNKLRELEANDAMFANRVKMLREDNKAILNKLPFETLAANLGTDSAEEGRANLGTGAAGTAAKNAAEKCCEKCGALHAREICGCGYVCFCGCFGRVLCPARNFRNE